MMHAFVFCRSLLLWSIDNICNNMNWESWDVLMPGRNGEERRILPSEKGSLIVQMDLISFRWIMESEKKPSLRKSEFTEREAREAALIHDFCPTLESLMAFVPVGSFQGHDVGNLPAEPDLLDVETLLTLWGKRGFQGIE